MRTSALLVVLSSIGAHAVPFLRPRANETLERREEPYKVVNVAGEQGSEVPAVETVTAVHPPHPPVTITITHTPSSSPSGAPLPWSSGPLATGTPGESNAFAPRGVNVTSKRSLRRSDNSTEIHPIFSRDNSTESRIFSRDNSTESRIASRDNSTESRIFSRSNSTATLAVRSNSTESRIFARGNDTASGLDARSKLSARSNSTSSQLTARSNDTVARGFEARSNTTVANLVTRSNSTLAARSNNTDSHLVTRDLNLTDRAVVYLRDALNATQLRDSHPAEKRSSNSTSLHA
ncbi:hypothetical protein BDV25DRAFT_165521 [Aspergillus avenaceus]|uniref:Uncharacterized protein n=1 Tax=Aspergillus avenaceus TaxID=36643 RepID=A0A5N6TFF6_ASPAV|nr:hypothetical protein BDV25DRAFT_165521 [Aspergillus avenaceus]